jgi:hypothetical protein
VGLAPLRVASLGRATRTSHHRCGRHEPAALLLGNPGAGGHPPALAGTDFVCSMAEGRRQARSPPPEPRRAWSLAPSRHRSQAGARAQPRLIAWPPPGDSTKARADHSRTRRSDEPGIIDERAGPRRDAGSMDRRRLRSTVLEDGRSFVRTGGNPRDQRLRAVSAHPAPQFGRKTRGSCSDDPRESSRARRPQGHRQRTKPQVSYSMRRPLIARAMTSCWICSVPSKMS